MKAENSGSEEIKSPGLFHLPSQHQSNASIVNNATENLKACTAPGGKPCAVHNNFIKQSRDGGKKNTSTSDRMLRADCFSGLKFRFQKPEGKDFHTSILFFFQVLLWFLKMTLYHQKFLNILVFELQRSKKKSHFSRNEDWRTVNRSQLMVLNKGELFGSGGGGGGGSDVFIQ